MRKSVKHAVVLGTALAVTAGAGAAYAAWVASGSGEAKAKAVTAMELTTSTVTVVGDLYPGATGNAKLQINNPNKYPVTVTGITGNGITVAGGTGACASTNVTFANQAEKSINVPAEGSTEVTLTGAVSMIADAQNGCQGATFTVSVLLAGVSAAA